MSGSGRAKFWCHSIFVVTTTLLSFQYASAQEAPPMMFDRPPDSPWWVSGQMNVIEQAHPTFSAAYSGPNSFEPESQLRVSRVLTLYTGLRLGHGWEVFLDLESAGGRGLSDAFGLGGFTNLDVVRNPSLGSAPYVARV